ncbi:MAG: MBL fold metallo-hydrolase [Candidatus Thorarchaeota archaeon]
MNVRLVALYENNRSLDSELKPGRGMSWYLRLDVQRILFDTGARGKTLMYNLEKLLLSPDDIDMLVFSHGHNDHTGGLPEFLKWRYRKDPIPIFGHPSLLEPKRAARVMKIGFPTLDSKLLAKVDFKLSKDPTELLPFIHTTGEIAHRPDKDGTGRIMQHQSEGKWEKDPLIDDLSLVLETSEGLVLICGCCHAGLLNTIRHVKETFGKEVVHVLGGTHMRYFQREDIEHVASVLENVHGLPKLSLGHCTGRTQIGWLQEKFGPEVVSPIHVGSEFTFTLGQAA